jgi:hypothetical protein
MGGLWNYYANTPKAVAEASASASDKRLPPIYRRNQMSEVPMQTAHLTVTNVPSMAKLALREVLGRALGNVDCVEEVTYSGRWSAQDICSEVQIRLCSDAHVHSGVQGFSIDLLGSGTEMRSVFHVLDASHVSNHAPSLQQPQAPLRLSPTALVTEEMDYLALTPSLDDLTRPATVPDLTSQQ